MKTNLSPAEQNTLNMADAVFGALSKPRQSPADDDGGRTRIGNTPAVDTDGQSPEAERLLDAARAAQTAFWDAIRALEDELDIEVASELDLENQTIESLIELDGDTEG